MTMPIKFDTLEYTRNLVAKIGMLRAEMKARFRRLYMMLGLSLLLHLVTLVKLFA